MTSLNINISEKRDIENVLRNIQSSQNHEITHFTTNFARGNEAAWSRFLRGAYNHPITWWVGIFQLQMQMGVWGHRYQSQASMKANRLWQITKPLRDEASAGLEGEDIPLLTAIVRYNVKYRKADIVGRLAGGRFTNYASMGGRFGSKRLSKFAKFAGGATNSGIASYGASIKALAEGYQTLEAVIQSILTGRPEDLPSDYNNRANAPLSREENDILDNLKAVTAEIMSLSQVAPSPTPIKEFCSRPENINLKGLCK